MSPYEEYVAIVPLNVSTLVEIREPGSIRYNDSKKLVAIKKIECSVEQAREIYKQLGQKLEELDALGKTRSVSDR